MDNVTKALGCIYIFISIPGGTPSVLCDCVPYKVYELLSVYIVSGLACLSKYQWDYCVCTLTVDTP